MILAMIQFVVLNDGRENESKIPPKVNFMISFSFLRDLEKTPQKNQNSKKNEGFIGRTD